MAAEGTFFGPGSSYHRGVARVLDVLTEAPRPCSYLDDRTASLFHRILVDVEPWELEAMLSRGWRRFGPDYFRPVCGTCVECVPTRIPLATFEASRSQKRAAKNAQRLRREYGPPRCDDARLQLYEKWHRQRELARGWEASWLGERSYRAQFAFPHPSARELAFYDGERLVGVSLCDETPAALSAIYFFFDPDYAKGSPGVGNVMSLVELGLQRGKQHLYLGFTVEACASLRYKASFQPREILIGSPGDDELAQWRVAG